LNKTEEGRIEADRKAAEVIEAATWLHNVWPQGRFCRWLLREFVFPNAARQNFEETLHSFLALPRHRVCEVKSRLSKAGSSVSYLDKKDSRALADDFLEKTQEWAADPSQKNRDAMIRAEIAYAMSAGVEGQNREARKARARAG
jgi:hypothetical protein